MAVDIEGNCRFYDVLRFRKMGKLSSGQARAGDDAKEGPHKFKLMQNICLEMTQDALLGITQSSTIFREEDAEPGETDPATAAAEAPPAKEPAKGGKNAPPVEEVEEAEPVPDTSEAEILQDRAFSDDKDKIKSLEDITQGLPEGNFFAQKSALSIFRYEDVIFAIFPHLAALKRRGA